MAETLEALVERLNANADVWTVHVREEEVATRHYTEDGERIYDRVYYLVAEKGTGERFASPHTHECYGSARSERRHLCGPGFDPVGRWNEIEPCYGSAAWGPENEARLAALDAEPGQTGWWNAYV